MIRKYIHIIFITGIFLIFKCNICFAEDLNNFCIQRLKNNLTSEGNYIISPLSLQYSSEYTTDKNIISENIIYKGKSLTGLTTDEKKHIKDDLLDSVFLNADNNIFIRDIPNINENYFALLENKINLHYKEYSIIDFYNKDGSKVTTSVMIINGYNLVSDADYDLYSFLSEDSTMIINIIVPKTYIQNLDLNTIISKQKRGELVTEEPLLIPHIIQSSVIRLEDKDTLQYNIVKLNNAGVFFKELNTLGSEIKLCDKPYIFFVENNETSDIISMGIINNISQDPTIKKDNIILTYLKNVKHITGILLIFSVPVYTIIKYKRRNSNE